MSLVPRAALGAPLFALALAAGAVAQEPTEAPPATSAKKDGGAPPHELLPDIGRIGAEAGILGGASWNPYGVGRGFHLGGFLAVPLARVPGGKLCYELHVSFSQATSDPFTITDPIAYVANLAAGASPKAALAGPPGAPFPVRRAVRTELHLLQSSPFGVRYTIRSLDHLRLRPYFGAGLDMVVVISKQRPETRESLEFTGTSPFDDDLIGGLVAQAPELAARGLPSGQGSVELGFHAGGGIEVRVARGLSLNLDYRFTGVGGDPPEPPCRERGLRVPLVTSTSPAEVFRTIDAREAEVGERLRALSEAVPAARAFARSLLRDQERQRAERDRLRRRLGLPAAAGGRAPAADPGSLAALRASQEALVHAHVEGLPALGDPPAVDRLAHHLVALARHLTVIDLWLEAEENHD